MAEVKKAEKAVVGEDMEYVTIPEKNIYDKPHPDIHHNTDTYVSGATYLVHKDVAGEIRNILETYNRAEIRLLRPDADARSVEQVNRNNRFGTVKAIKAD